MKIQHLNLLSNFGSRIFLGLSSFITTPLVIRFMGIEAYGLVGFFTIISTFLGLLDFGFSGALSREVAAQSGSANTQVQIRNLIRTLEIYFWVLAALIAIILILSVDTISSHWIQSDNLTPSLIHRVLILMSLSLASQWPFTIYSNVLMGLERQVINNGIQIVFTIFRSYGGVLFLWGISSALESYFLYQIGVNLLQTLIGMWIIWKILPHPTLKARFDWSLLKKIRKYAAGMSILAFLSFFMMHMDKLILSKMLSLESFGYYMLATNLAGVLYIFISPIFATYFPRLTQLLAVQKNEELKEVYHESCQMISVLVLSLALILIFFSPEVLYFWTRNKDIVENSSLLVRCLVIGTACNGIMNMPYALQLAHGITKYSIYQNIVSVIILIPITVIAVHSYGIKGAVLTWLIHNVGCVFIMAPFFHRKFLPSEQSRWALHDVLLPLFASSLVVSISRFFFTDLSSRLHIVLVCGVTAIFAIFFSLLSVFSYKLRKNQQFAIGIKIFELGRKK